MPWKETVWRAGVYVGVYTSATAEAVYKAWPYERVRSEGRLLKGWLTEHWAGIPLRRERRAVRTPEKLARCLLSYRDWMQVRLSPWLDALPADRFKAYDMLWQAADKNLYGFGRYALTKLFDFYEKYCDIAVTCPDIRPIEGWSPRETLVMFYPDAATRIAPRTDTPSAINATNAAAARAKEALANVGYDLDWFRFEVLLCEVRQSIVRERQYPGRSADSELSYLRKVESYWHTPSDIWDIRKAVHPAETLGELSGWDGVRDDLGGWLNRIGTTWSDLLWQWHADGEPTRRVGGLGGIVDRFTLPRQPDGEAR